ncbi:hypothetical protein OM416_16640 [Paenibacillus sp. LS1]|uniref:hypothetical protein n=1 Tax=Paenibacillus sp. LS1 TaxID=2992120 RepID=UPI00223041CC|nr:hypothetical protein [Paenibacillus sp. LS1]MCW3793220.1 hypothetical protein [Paenibacillus sp. LS1]
MTITHSMMQMTPNGCNSLDDCSDVSNNWTLYPIEGIIESNTDEKGIDLTMRKLAYVMGTLFLSAAMLMGCTSSEPAESTESVTPSVTEQPIDVSDQKATVEEQLQALEMSLDYKTTELTVDGKDYDDMLEMQGLQAKGETMKPFLTSRNYEAYMANGYILLLLQVAHIEQAKLHPENIQTKIKDSKSDWILVEYTLDLKFTDENGKEFKSIPISGDITFLQDQGEWRIQDDTYNRDAFADIINNSL